MPLTPTPFFDAAVAYAQRGWRVFQIPPGQKIPKVRWKHGGPEEVATADVLEVERRSLRQPGCNIGIATGQGLAVLDVDPQHGGAVPGWAPRTLTARTPSGGAHLYYAVEGEVPNSQGRLGPGLDVRGDGGMVLAPPSELTAGEYTEGGRYEWVDPAIPLASIPVSQLKPPAQSRTSGPRLAARTFGEGERHDAMLALAGKMRSIGCEYPEILAALNVLNVTRFSPRLEDEWVDKVAKSIVRYAPDSDLLP